MSLSPQFQAIFCPWKRNSVKSYLTELEKNIIPTIGGDTIYRYAKEILDLIYKAELEIKLIKNQVIGELKIGGSTIPGCYILPKVISKYCKAYPKVEVQLQIFDSEQVVGKVADGSLDVGITGAVFDREDLLFKKNSIR